MIQNYFNYFIQITGSQATPLTNPLCPLSVVTDWKLFIHQMIMVLSTLLLANHLSWTDHARSRISPKFNNIHICVCQYFENISFSLNLFQPEWPRSMVWQRQFSTLFEMPELPKLFDGPTPRFQSIIILSSPPDASVTPLLDHRTQFTHAKWFSNWHNFFEILFDFSAFSSITGNKLQIATEPQSVPNPPVANLVPSGWISMENIGFPAI